MILLPPATMNINAACIFTYPEYSVFIAGAITNGNVIGLNGDFTPGTNTVVFNGSDSASQMVPQLLRLYNVTVAKTAGTLLSTGGSTIALTTNNFTETTCNSAPATLNINGNFSDCRNFYCRYNYQLAGQLD
jgi:hypothetical protein